MIWSTIAQILFDILTYGIFLYSAILLLSYILIGLYSIGETKKHLRKNVFTDFRILAASVHAPSVSVLAPAYNEGLNIVENVKSLLSIYYVNLEVIIINDGSKDDSLSRLIEAFDLEKIDFFIHEQIPTKEVRGIYKSRNSIHHKLIVVDKVNGGKADALNVGINVSSNKYLVCIDVDCVLEQDALLKMIKPFLEQKQDKRVIASGGVVRIANSCTIEDGRLVKIKLADEYLPQMQILEYIRAFILGRMAWTRLNGLMLISGAFGAFDKEIAIKAGGYDHKTVGEDMELVVRMRRYMEEHNEPYLVTYIPDPLCWTEAPSNFKILGRQRNRWIRGTYETLKFHKIMFFNPKYHLLGMLSYPYWFFFELCAPVIEFFGFICFLIFAFFGMLDWSFFFTFFLFIISFGYLYSCFAILMEVFTFNQYKRRIDILRLMMTGLTEPFYYHPFVVWSAIKGFRDLITNKKGWGEMTRAGLSKKVNTVEPVPVTPAVNLQTESTVHITVLQSPVSEPEEKKEASSLLERKIVPGITKLVNFITGSFGYFISRALVLFGLMLVARVFEFSLDYLNHGTAQNLGKVILYGFGKDLALFLQFAFYGFLIFTALCLINKKLAHISFVVFSVLYLVIQIALSQYFIRTLVPLGADLWAYSLADIKQTLGASGGIKPYMILVFVLFIGLTVSAFVFLPRKMKISGWKSFLLFIGFLVTSTSDLLSKTNEWNTGQEYSNNLAMNKAWFFLDNTYLHFFPKTIEKDIYADYDFGSSENQNENFVPRNIQYVDEKNYPFLHKTDSTAEVLSPFFKKDSTPPNIVILLVEGLGRAFTNEGAYLGNFTPFIDSLSKNSLYWENFLSEGGRTFAALPSVLGSLPFAKNGFDELGAAMPRHLSLLNVLESNGYQSDFYYGGDAHFDNMDDFLKINGINHLNEEQNFPAGYQKMPSQNGFTWGYGDKELFRRYFETRQDQTKPHVSVLLTVSTHDPFFINEQDLYLKKFEDRMNQLGLSDDIKKKRRNYRYQFASILYLDDALRNFMNQYSKRPDFKNTVFLITGDHRMPEISMSSKIDRYHVPFIIYSPLLQRTAKFASISTHFDITPSLLAWLHKSNRINIPEMASWIGTGLDTTRVFSNVHAYPIMQTKNDLIDFVMGRFMLNGENLFRIEKNMDLTPENNPGQANRLKAAFQRFLLKNNQFIAKPSSIEPDSLVQRFSPH
ncbi:MAG: sulfatase-like hydrolase/transferase [Bacteroidota bacterium]|nr:sulfatase-like hydrolase/transferase [Bacteroidota bacterium]